MDSKATLILQEALAVIGMGLFAFGVWQVYKPAGVMVLGLFMMAPFALSLRRA